MDIATPFLRSKYRLKGYRVTVKRAPEPTDIMWENLGASISVKVLHRALTIFTTVICAAFGFGLIILINWVQVSQIEDITAF